MRVTYYYPWGCFYPAHGGAATVAARHLAWFRSRGWQPRIVLLGDVRGRERSDFERHYSWVHDIQIVSLRDFPPAGEIRDACEPIRLLRQHAALCDAPDVQNALRAPADVFFLNYFFAAPFLDLAPPDCCRVLETHDIFFSDLKRWKLPPVTAQHHLRMELELYRLFDAAIMLNPDEAGLAQSRGAAAATLIPQGIEIPPTAGLCNAAPTHDLLFVGSAHKPNIDGAEWFYHHVFRPHLKPHGVTWAIAGSMCERIRFRDRQVLPLGRVENLVALYRDSRIVVIPLFEGSGMSIKTLEALAHGKAVVSTVTGLRGLGDHQHIADAMNFELDPRAVADRILQLRKSPGECDALGRRAVEFIRSNFSISQYERRMDELFERLTNPPSAVCETPVFAA